MKQWTAQEKAEMRKKAQDQAYQRMREAFPNPASLKAVEYFETNWRWDYLAMVSGI